MSVDKFIVESGDAEKSFIHGFTHLGKVSAIQQRGYCPFCRLVLEIVDRPPDQRSPSRNAYQDPTVRARWVVDGQEEIAHEEPASEKDRFVPKTRRILIYSEPQAFKDGYIVLAGESAPFPHFFGRQLSPHELEQDMLRKWIRTCEDEHGAECEEPLVHPDLMREYKNVLRMVDVERMCVTEVPQNCRFVALSYLWGNNFHQLFTTSENLPRLSMPGALQNRHLPHTIRDAINLTRMLGERYLWTDSLALVHDQGFQYHDDWIYARAHITVVAGSGKDADAGLPGVRKGSRMWHQPIQEVKDGVKLMVCHLAEDYISTSQWDSRAWTFAERMLARRCLLFVNGRVYFQCRRTTFCEDIEMPEPNSWSLDSIDMPTRIFREPEFVQFTSAVELYTRRELTNPNDILNAFDGVKQVLEKRLDTTIYSGLHETRIDSSLIWESSKRLERRPGFPSWSWAGWFGEIQWKFTEAARSWIDWTHAEEGHTQHAFPEQALSRIEPPVPRRPYRMRIARKLSTNNIPLLHFSTITAVFRLGKIEDIHKSVISPLRKRLTGPSALSTVRPAPPDSGLMRASIEDADGQWCGTIDVEQRWKSCINCPLEFVVLSRLSRFDTNELLAWEGQIPDVVEEEIQRFDYGVYNVMLVSMYNGVYFREGLGRIIASALDRSLEPPNWKDILLG